MVFDGFGRKKQVIDADGKKVASEFTDPAGRTRKSVQDGLGRLVQVNEAGLYDTYYRYNGRGDLLGVCQGAAFDSSLACSGLGRTFEYDTLSRLVSATNPESGETLYTYDKNGNLLARRDARSVTTSFDAYDDGDRPTRKAYLNDPASTPAVRYCYDGADYATAGCTGAATALKKMQLTAVGSDVSVTRYTEFDSLGRVTKSSQSASPTTAYGFEYRYHLDGSMRSQKYPSGREVVSQFDTAGRVSAVEGYLTSVAYSDHGALQRLVYGNGYIEQICYNNRLQPQRITVKT